jgi:ketosteroid isomerase-like protein
MNRSSGCWLGGILLATTAATVSPAAGAAPGAEAAPAPASTPADPAASIREVEAAVRAWAAAWSARDVARYLAAYAPDFTPPRGQDRKAWEADRRARIADKATISVSIDSLVISVQGQAASAGFQQTYSADKLREKSRKTLELQRVGEQWLIRKESAG